MPQSPAKNHLESPAHAQGTYNYTPRMNGSMDRPSSQGTIGEDVTQNYPHPAETPKTTRTKDPMAFSSILSSNAPEPPKSTPRVISTSKQLKSSSNTPNGDAKPVSGPSRKSLSKATASPKDYQAPMKRPVKAEFDAPMTTRPFGSSKPRPATSDKENEKVKKEMAKIEAMELSDVESPEWQQAKQQHVLSSQKRQHDVEAAEDIKRKVCEAPQCPR